MNTNDFLPFKITEGINTSTPFIAVSDTFPSDNFEVWTKENLEEMKKKNFNTYKSSILGLLMFWHLLKITIFKKINFDEKQRE